MKYLQIYPTTDTSPTMLKDYLKHLRGETGYGVLMSSGPYNWIKAFDGHMAWATSLPEITLDNGEIYEITPDDIVHVHVHGESANLVNKIKTLCPSVTVVASIDYGINLWQSALGFTSIADVTGMIEHADFIFSTEPTISYILSNSLKRDVPCIPHPVDTSIASYRKPYKVPRICVVMLHNYTEDYYTPTLALDNVPYIEKVLLGVNEKNMGVVYNLANGILYNRIFKYSSFEYLISKRITNNDGPGGILPEAYMAYDSYNFKVTGRFQTDCALLGVPCIGSNLSFMQKILYPKLTTNLYDIEEQNIIAGKLLDIDFHREVEEYAMIGVQRFNFDNTKTNFKNFIDGKDYIDWRKT